MAYNDGFIEQIMFRWSKLDDDKALARIDVLFCQYLKSSFLSIDQKFLNRTIKLVNGTWWLNSHYGKVEIFDQ